MDYEKSDYVGHKDEIDTPALLVDAGKLENNIKKMAMQAKQWGVKLRPHVKTHKNAWIAGLQMETGAAGLTVAKLGEAEVMIQHGFTNLLLAYPIVGEPKLNVLARLLEKANITVALDSREVAEGLNSVARRLGRSIPVYVEVDTGLRRCGLEPGRETVALVARLAELEHIQLQGLMTHGGHVYRAHSEEEVKQVAFAEGTLLAETRDQIAAELGIRIPEISVGSTPTSRYSGLVPGVTEMRPGTYVFQDVNQIQLGSASEEECALTVLATVVSCPAPDRVVVDAGSKTLSSDRTAFYEGYGLVKGLSGAYVARLSEEHGVLHLPDHCQGQLRVGQKIEIIPNHVCPVVNLADEMMLIRDGEVEHILPVDARGRTK